MTMPDAKDATPKPGPDPWLSIASTISWLWAALMAMVLVSLLAALPALRQRVEVSAAVPELVGMALLTIGSGIGAFGLRKRKKRYRVIAAISSGAWMLVLFLARVKVSTVGILLNLAVLAIVLARWRRFS
jgi:hypothetical protein